MSGDVEAGNGRQLRRQERALDVADHFELAIKGFEGVAELVAQDEIGRAAAKETALPVEHGDHRLVQFSVGWKEHDGDVDALVCLVMREGDQRLKAFQVKMRGIVGLQARGQVIDDDRFVGIGDFAQQAAGEAREEVALGPGIEMFLEARGAGDQIKGRRDIPPGD